MIPLEVERPNPEEFIEIDLKEPWIAGLLAWLLPGLGHVYQGRTGKGLLFFVCILGTFIYGLYLGEGHVVYASTEPLFSRQSLERWQYYCQLGVGAPALPALVQRDRVLERQEPIKILGSPYMAPPQQGPVPSIDASDNLSHQPNEQAKWIVESHPHFELGTVYTVIAGLLNVLVICDAFGGPLIIRPKEKKSKEEPPPPQQGGGDDSR